MNAYELIGIETLLERRQRVANEVLVAADVQRDVVVGGADPIDVTKIDHLDATLAADRDAGEMSAVTGQLADQIRQPCADRLALENSLPCMRERPVEPVGFNGLEHVVERMHLEGAERILVEGGDKNYRGQPRHVKRTQHFETIELGHLDIEKHDIGPR